MLADLPLEGAMEMTGTIGVRGWIGAMALVIVAAVALGQSGDGASVTHRFERPVIVVGLPNPSHVRGMLTTDANGNRDGYAMRLTLAAAEAVGLRVEFRDLAKEDPIEALERGDVDAVATMSVLESRLGKVDFTGPIVMSRGVVISREGAAAVTTPEHLRGARVVVAKGGVGQQWCIEHNVPVRECSSLTMAIREVAEGRADYLLTLQAAARYELEKMGVTGLKEHQIKDDSPWRAFAIAVKRGNTVLMSDLDVGLTMLRESGRFDRIYDEWMAKYQPASAERRVPLATVVWGATFAGLLIVACGAWLLARQRRVLDRVLAERLSGYGSPARWDEPAEIQSLNRPRWLMRAVEGSLVPLWGKPIVAAFWWLVFAFANDELSTRPMGLPIAWLPCGVGLWSILCQRSTRARWAALGGTLVAATVWMRYIGNTWATVAADVAADGAELLVAWGLVHSLIERRGVKGKLARFETLRETLILAVPTAVAAGSVGAMVLCGLISLQNEELPIGHAMLWKTWSARTLAVMLGITLTQPILAWLFAWLRGEVAGYSWQRATETAAALTATLAATLLVYHFTPEGAGTALAMVCLPIPLMMLCGLRLGPAGAAAAGLIVCLVVVGATNDGVGPIAGLRSSLGERLLAMQAFVGITSVSALLLAAAVWDRKASESSLQASEVRYRVLTNNVPGLVYAYHIARNGARSKVYASPQLARFEQWIPGFTFDGDFKENILPHIHPDDRAGFVDASRRAREENVAFETDFRLITNGDGVRWIHSVALPIPRRDGVVWQGLLIDITAQRRAEEALVEAQERLLAAIEGAGMGTWSIDLATMTIRPDANLLRMFELKGEANTPRPTVDFTGRAHPDDRERVVESLGRAMRGESLYRAEYRVQLADGKVRWLASRGTPHSGVDGKPVRITGACVDITREKQAAEERERLESRLEQTQRLESLGMLAGGIAHDFNNILVGILGNATLASASLPTEHPARKAVATIEQAAQRAADLTRQMLAYAGKTTVQWQPIDLGSLLTEMVQLLDLSIGKHATVRFDLAHDLPMVTGDATQLRQIVMNLLTNASEAIGEHPGEITVRTRAARLTESDISHGVGAPEAKPGEYLCMEVVDTGAGMSEETLSRIFDPFFTTKFSGRGLGLSAVLGITRSHRGVLMVKSQPGEGTSFRVYLPPASGGAAAEAPRADRVFAGSGTILVVDDEPLVRDVATRSLERAGYRVVSCESGEAALARVDKGGIDGIVLDLTMPGMGGKRAFEEMRRRWADLPIVMSSGFTEDDAADRILREPKVGFIQKPYTAEQLAGVVRDVVGK